MSEWHKEILVPGQRDLLSAVKSFAKDFGLVGGTAIALHIGHRESIDFDLFTKKLTGRQRGNYHKKTRHYFSLYFGRHAPSMHA